MQLLEKIFPSLRRSPEAREAKSQLEGAAVENDDATDRFVKAVENMIKEFDLLRDEVRQKNRGGKHATTGKK